MRVKCARNAWSACFIANVYVKFEMYEFLFISNACFVPMCNFQVQQDIFKSKYNCNNGTECASLTGLFDCSLGKYVDISSMYTLKVHFAVV